MTEKPYVGGQAVIEGVMMRAPRSLAIAVRRPDGHIVVREDAWISIWEHLRFLRWPFLRGSVVLAESVYNGIQALNFAAEHAIAEDDPPKPRATGTALLGITGITTPGGTAGPSGGSSSSGAAGTIAISFLLAIGLFVGLPHLLAWGTGRLLGIELGVDTFLFHVLDGVFKLLIFVGYIAGISLIPEIRRVFQYHGAEHKVVNLYENDQPLTLENARGQTTFHARCGTSFILFVLVLSILMFALVFPLIPPVSEIAIVNHLAMIVIKIPLMFPLAGIAYELNRLAARHPDRAWVQLFVAPGRLMQRLTTREPSDDQLEIALAAMKAALRREATLLDVDAAQVRAAREAQPVGGHVLVFESYGALSDALEAGH